MSKVGSVCTALSAAALLWGTTACSSGGDDVRGPASSPISSPAASPASSPASSGVGQDPTAPDGGSSGPDAKDAAGSAPAGKAGGRAPTAQTAVLKSLPGRPDGGCVEVGERRDVRSGGIAAGPFEEARATFRKQQRTGQPAAVRLYFIPATGGSQLPGLHLAVRDVGTGQVSELEERSTSDADQWTFYDTEVAVPRPGAFEIRATSGSDTGCFLVRFGGGRS